MAYQSEYALENEVLQQLENLDCERANIHNVKSEINICLNKKTRSVKI